MGPGASGFWENCLEKIEQRKAGGKSKIDEKNGKDDYAVSGSGDKWKKEF